MKVTHAMLDAGLRIMNTTDWMVRGYLTPTLLAQVFEAMLKASVVHDRAACAMLTGRGFYCTCDAYDLSAEDLLACLHRANPPFRPARLPAEALAFAQEIQASAKARWLQRLRDELEHAAKSRERDNGPRLG